jgi:hypothetical protein
VFVSKFVAAEERKKAAQEQKNEAEEQKKEAAISEAKPKRPENHLSGKQIAGGFAIAAVTFYYLTLREMGVSIWDSDIFVGFWLLVFVVSMFGTLDSIILRKSQKYKMGFGKTFGISIAVLLLTVLFQGGEDTESSVAIKPQKPVHVKKQIKTKNQEDAVREYRAKLIEIGYIPVM